MSCPCLVPVLSSNVHPSATMKERHNMRFFRDCMQGSIIKDVITLEILVTAWSLQGLGQLSAAGWSEVVLGALWVCRGTMGQSGASPNQFSKGTYGRGATGDSHFPVPQELDDGR